MEYLKHEDGSYSYIDNNGNSHAGLSRDVAYGSKALINNDKLDTERGISGQGNIKIMINDIAQGGIDVASKIISGTHCRRTNFRF